MNSLESGLIFQETLYRIDSKVIVVINGSWSEMNDAEKMLLGKILESVRLKLDGVAIVSSDSNVGQIAFSQKPTALINFDPSFNHEFEKYSIGDYEGVPYLGSDPLSDLNDQKKKQLWSALKKMFLG